MKFSTRKDADAPAEFVFAQLTDFDAIERKALRRGIEVERKAAGGPDLVGAAWRLRFPFRGKTRDVDATLVRADPAQELHFDSVAGGLAMTATIELVALSRQRTRLVVGLDLRASSLSARVMLQSAKFAKVTLERRFEQRIGDYCEDLTARYARAMTA